MPDLRYRSFRLQVYARLCPTNLRPLDRERFLQLLEATDEDGMIAFFQQLPSEPRLARALNALQEARELGDRLNAMDRTLPVLPHTEISACYDRLRVLGNDIGDMIAVEKPT